MSAFGLSFSRNPHPTVDLMIDYLERGRGGERLVEHVSSCPSCRTTLERHKRLLALDNAVGRPRTNKDRPHAWFLGL